MTCYENSASAPGCLRRFIGSKRGDSRDERRTILWTLPAAAAALMTAIPEALRGSSTPPTWDEFTTRLSRLAKDLSAPATYDEDTYVYHLAAEAVQACDPPASAKMGRFGKLDPAVEFAPAYRGALIMIVQWRLAPNAWLPPHNHPHYDVVSVGLEGEAVVTHYDLDGDAPPFDIATPFAVRRTRQMLIAPRRVSALTSSRDNIHTFQAGATGARGIDINTRYGKDIGFSFLRIDSTLLDKSRDTYTAKWVGQTPM